MYNYLFKNGVFQGITDGRHKPRGGEYKTIYAKDKFEFPVISLDENNQEVVSEDVVKLKGKLVTFAYDLMVKDIYDQMLVVFGTSNDISASAFAATWEAMRQRPTNYIDPLIGFTSEADVIAYADAKLNQADAYGIFRIKRIEQFKAEKATILA